jgi:ABC-type branched-subunit amino acid transport system permease subunit
LAACVAAGAWMLGTIPIFRGGAFLNTECLPQWVGPEHLRAAASWAWELAAVISVLCAVLIMFRILRRRGETR